MGVAGSIPVGGNQVLLIFFHVPNLSAIQTSMCRRTLPFRRPNHCPQRQGRDVYLRGRKFSALVGQQHTVSLSPLGAAPSGPGAEKDWDGRRHTSPTTRNNRPALRLRGHIPRFRNAPERENLKEDGWASGISTGALSQTPWRWSFRLQVLLVLEMAESQMYRRSGFHDRHAMQVHGNCAKEGVDPLGTVPEVACGVSVWLVGDTIWHSRCSASSLKEGWKVP